MLSLPTIDVSGLPSVANNLLSRASNLGQRGLKKLGQRALGRTWLQPPKPDGEGLVARVRQTPMWRYALEGLKDAGILRPDVGSALIRDSHVGRVLTLGMLVRRLGVNDDVESRSVGHSRRLDLLSTAVAQEPQPITVKYVYEWIHVKPEPSPPGIEDFVGALWMSDITSTTPGIGPFSQIEGYIRQGNDIILDCDLGIGRTPGHDIVQVGPFAQQATGDLAPLLEDPFFNESNCLVAPD